MKAKLIAVVMGAALSLGVSSMAQAAAGSDALGACFTTPKELAQWWIQNGAMCGQFAPCPYIGVCGWTVQQSNDVKTNPRKYL